MFTYILILNCHFILKTAAVRFKDLRAKIHVNDINIRELNGQFVKKVPFIVRTSLVMLAKSFAGALSGFFHLSLNLSPL